MSLQHLRLEEMLVNGIKESIDNDENLSRFLYSVLNNMNIYDKKDIADSLLNMNIITGIPETNQYVENFKNSSGLLHMYHKLMDTKEILVKNSALNDFKMSDLTLDNFELPFNMMIYFEDVSWDFLWLYNGGEYIHKGKKYPVITMRIMGVKQIRKSLEVYIIEPMLPRFFIRCMDRDCEKRISSNIFSDCTTTTPDFFIPKSDNEKIVKGIMVKGIDGIMVKGIDDLTICKKGLTTIDACQGLEGDITVAEHILKQIIFTRYILDRINRIPQKIIKEIKGTKRTRYNKDKNSEPIIYIDDKTYKYIKPESNEIKMNPERLIGDRQSPCEHFRRGHYRTLKSGKKVWVRDSKINDGGKKPRYIIK